MIMTQQSQLTGAMNTRDIDVTEQELREWISSGRPIQQVLGHLSAADREFLLTGATPEEWDAAFPDDEDYEDEE
jgi:hypothetical protein